MNRNELIDRCKAIIKDAYEEATEMIVAYLELYPAEQTQSLCKEIDEENWNALDSRVRRRQKARKANAGADSKPSRAVSDSRVRHVKSALRKAPEIVAELTPDEQRALARKLDEESAKRQKERKEVAAKKEREHLGGDVVEDLAFAESLKSTEYLLIKARGNIAGFVRDTQEFGAENAPDAWRESCLVWINDLDATLGMAKALLEGGEVDDAAINEWLSKEV